MHAAWILTTVEIADPAAFARYRAAVAQVNAALGGDMLVRGTVAEVLEGADAAGGAVACLGFASAAAARSYIASAEYGALAGLRAAAGAFTIRLVT